MMKFSVLLSAALLFIFTGCSSSKVENNSDANKIIPAKIDWANEQIAPDHCRITGTIVSIDSTLENDSLQTPCSKVPCNAVVRIDSVIGYGSNFSPLSTNKLIDVHFNFTLAPTTKNLFPNLKKYFPGVQIGTMFKGDIYSEMNKGSFDPNKRKFQIDAYQVIKLKIF